MKELKTYLNEGFFTNVGGDIKSLIRQWVEEHIYMGYSKKVNFDSIYRINDKLEIEPIDGRPDSTVINFIKPLEDGQLPDYIHFSNKWRYTIYAIDCGLTSLKGFPEKIISLDASKNDIRSLKDSTIKKCDQLILDSNHITSFEGFPFVRYDISVRDNQIYDFDKFPALKALSTLDVSSNRIQRFDSINFTNCKIRDIYIGYNNVKDLYGLQYIRKHIYMHRGLLGDFTIDQVREFVRDKGNIAVEIGYSNSW